MTTLTRYRRNPTLSPFGDVFRMFNDDFPFVSPRNDGWTPAVNVEETPEELRLTAELPGVSADDVEIDIENNVLTVRGEKHEERSEDDAEHRVHLWERRSGSFTRSFTLPRTVNANDITADYDNGVVTVRMPKAPEARGRKIKVAQQK